MPMCWLSSTSWQSSARTPSSSTLQVRVEYTRGLGCQNMCEWRVCKGLGAKVGERRIISCLAALGQEEAKKKAFISRLKCEGLLHNTVTHQLV